MNAHRKKIAAVIAMGLLGVVGITAARAGNDGLVAAYSFNENGGTLAFDSSGQANNGAIAGATWSAGKYGSALSFDGDSDMVTVPNAASLKLQQGMTIEAWVQPDSTADWTSVVLKEAPAGLAYSLYASTPYGGGGGWVRPTNSGDFSAETARKLALGTWNHISATWDGTTLRYYENGVQKSSRKLSRTARSLISSDGALRIGGNKVWGEWFDGRIDEVRIYNRALTQAEIRSDQATPVGTQPDTAPPDTVASSSSTSTTSTTASTTTTTTTTSTTVPSTPPVTGGGTVPPPSAAGVTLRPIDGGPDYFARWSNSFSTAPTFYPVGVWGETFIDDSSSRNLIDNYATMGINFFPGDWGLPAGIGSYMNSKGMYSNAGGGSNPAKGAQTTTDEPDWRGCASNSGGVAGDAPAAIGQCATMNSPTGAANSGPVHPSFMQKWFNYLKAQDPTRPVWTNFTKIEKAGTDAQDYWVDEADAKAYIAGADVISYDWYVLTDAGHYTPSSWGYVWKQGDAVRNTRRLAEYAKPVSAFIETSYVTDYATYRPTAADVNAEVWNAIIGGARGITYFNHDFKVGSGRVLFDSRYADIGAQVTRTNALIKSLAPVLNAPYADGYATAPTTLNTMVKAYNGSYYIFATSRQTTSLTTTLNIRTGTNVEVVGENRTLPVTGGTFTDTFANQNTVHIYKITP